MGVVFGLYDALVAHGGSNYAKCTCNLLRPLIKNIVFQLVPYGCMILKKKNS